MAIDDPSIFSLLLPAYTCSAEDDAVRPEKRSRTNARHGPRSAVESPSKNSAPGRSPTTEQQPPSSSKRPSTLAPIQPIGFAASREARRDGDNDVNRAIPSPVVLGFDFKSVDEEQMKTVRDTISIKEQQQALIAQRRKEMAASQPTTPRELTFKGWTPKDPEKRGVGARREKTRDKVERMSIVTTATDKDVVPGSKSAPLNQGLASQQQSPREPPSGSQTAVHPHHLPPLHHHYGHHPHHLADPRTAPLSAHSRSARPDEFGRGEHQYYQAAQQAQRPSGPPSANPSTRSRDARYPDHLGRSAQPNTADRRNFSVPSIQGHPTSAHHARFPPLSPHGPPPSQPPGSARPTNGVHRSNGYSLSPSPPHPREQFLQPFVQLYDMLSSVDQLRYQLQDMIHRSDQAYASQMAATNEFKSTAAQASNLLGTLQQSADSLKEMVRYEVERAERREVDELRERVRALEERLHK